MILDRPLDDDILLNWGASLIGQIPPAARKKHNSPIIRFKLGKRRTGCWFTLKNGNTCYRKHPYCYDSHRYIPRYEEK
jgi:hypothetical protein